MNRGRKRRRSNSSSSSRKSRRRRKIWRRKTRGKSTRTKCDEREKGSESVWPGFLLLEWRVTKVWLHIASLPLAFPTLPPPSSPFHLWVPHFPPSFSVTSLSPSVLAPPTPLHQMNPHHTFPSHHPFSFFYSLCSGTTNTHHHHHHHHCRFFPSRPSSRTCVCHQDQQPTRYHDFNLRPLPSGSYFHSLGLYLGSFLTILMPTKADISVEAYSINKRVKNKNLVFP